MENLEEQAFSLPDNFANPFRIEPPEGEMMAVKKGSPDGPLERFYASVAGWHFRYQDPREHGYTEDPDEWMGDPVAKWDLLPDILADGTRVYTPPVPETAGMLENEFGIIWTGFGRALYKPHIRYAKWETKRGDVTASLVEKNREGSPFFFFHYNMAIPVVQLEVEKGTLQLTLNINTVVRIVNPYKALFLAGGWESLFNSAVNGLVRDFLSHKSYEDIVAIEESGGESLAKAIMKLNTRRRRRDEGEFQSKFGIEVIDVRFESFQISNKNPKVQESFDNLVIADNRAKASKKDANTIKTIGAAEAEAAAKLVNAYGGGANAARVREAQLLKEGLIGTSASVVSIGNPMPVAVTPPGNPSPQGQPQRSQSRNPPPVQP